MNALNETKTLSLEIAETTETILEMHYSYPEKTKNTYIFLASLGAAITKFANNLEMKEEKFDEFMEVLKQQFKSIKKGDKKC